MEQQEGLCTILQGTSVLTLHTILLGVGGTIYNNHSLEPLKELGLDSQRVKRLAPKLHVRCVNHAFNLPTSEVPSSASLSSLIRSRLQAKPIADPPILHRFSFRWRNLRKLVSKGLLFLHQNENVYPLPV
jgi:hypothetical protein